MSYSFPASVEREIERYAQSEHLTPDEAATRLIQEALREKSPAGPQGEITEAEWKRLGEDPTFAFLTGLSNEEFECIEVAYRQSRAERLVSRG